MLPFDDEPAQIEFDSLVLLVGTVCRHAPDKQPCQQTEPLAAR